MIPFALLLAVELAGGWTMHGPAPGEYTSEVAVAAGSGRRIFAVTFEGAESRNGIYRSEDGGSSWELVSGSPGPGSVCGFAADPRDPDRLFAATCQVLFPRLTTRLYRSDDGGTSWEQRSSSCCRIVFDATDPAILYVFSSGSSVDRSLDGGETFESLPLPFTLDALASAADGTLVAVSDFDVFLSRDRGESWTPAASLPIACSVRALAADPIEARRCYVGTGSNDYPCGQVIRTDDGGATWTVASELSAPVEHLVIDGQHPGVLYAEAGDRVLASADFGATWTDLGLPVADGASSLALGEGGKRRHAGTRDGAYELSLRRTTALPPR